MRVYIGSFVRGGGAGGSRGRRRRRCEAAADPRPPPAPRAVGGQVHERGPRAPSSGREQADLWLPRRPARERPPGAAGARCCARRRAWHGRSSTAERRAPASIFRTCLRNSAVRKINELVKRKAAAGPGCTRSSWGTSGTRRVRDSSTAPGTCERPLPPARALAQGAESAHVRPEVQAGEAHCGHGRCVRARAESCEHACATALHRPPPAAAAAQTSSTLVTKKHRLPQGDFPNMRGFQVRPPPASPSPSPRPAHPPLVPPSLWAGGRGDL